MQPFSIKALVSLWFWKGYDLPNTNYYVSCNTWVHMIGAPFPTLTRLVAAWTESPAGNMGLLIILQLLIGAGTGWDHSLLFYVLISLAAVFPKGQLYFRCTSNVQYLTAEDMGRKMKCLPKNRSSPHKITQVAPSQPIISFALSYFSHLHFIAMLRREKKERKRT